MEVNPIEQLTQHAGMYLGTVQDADPAVLQLPETVINILDAQTKELIGDLGEHQYDADNHLESLEDGEFFDFQTSQVYPDSQYLTKRNRLIIPVDGFFRECIIDEIVRENKQVAVRSSASYFEMQKDKPIAPVELQGQTVNTAADYILRNSEWVLGVTQSTNLRTIVFDEYISPYQALGKIASEFDLELRFRVEVNGSRVSGRYVDLIKKTGDYNGVEITSGKNLINAKRTEKNNEICTALTVIGPEDIAGNQIVVEVFNEEARLIWGEDGKHKWGIYRPDSDDEEMTEERLRTLGENELEKIASSKIEWEIQGSDIHTALGRSHEKVRLGDEIRVKVTDFDPDIYLTSRIIRREGSIKKGMKKNFVLGEFIEYSEADFDELKKLMLRRLRKRVTEQQLEAFTYTKSEIEQLDSTTLQNAQTYASTEDEGVYQDSTLYTDQQKQNLTNEIENGQVSIPGGSISGFIELANTTLRNAASTVYTDNQGNFIFIDPNDTNNVVKISSQGIGVSTSGILGPFENAIAGKGINATAIVTGFMSFERARGGFLQIGGEDNDLGRFIVYGANGTPVADIDNGKASFLDVSAENFSSPVVPRLNTQTYTLRVDPLNGDDSASGLGPWDSTGPDAPLKTLSEAFRRLPQVNEGEITIQLHYYNSGDVSEGRMELKGVSGSGRIIIDGQRTATTVNGSLFVEGCTNEIIMQDITINSTAYAIIDWRRSSGALTNVILYGNMQSTVGLDVTQGFLDMDNVEIYDATLTVLRGRNANIYAINTKGLGGSYGIFAQRNAKIGVHGTIPGGGISATLEDYGGTIDGLENTTVDLGSATPPAPPETTQTWTANDAATWHIGFNLWDDYYGATPTQGEWSGSGPYSGFWFFGTGVSTALTGKSISQLQVYIQRQGGGGYGGPVTHYIRWHGHATQPGSPADESQSSDVVTVNLATGDSAWVTLPISFRTAFENGSAKGIGVYTSNTSNAYYSRLQQGAKIKATYQ